MNGSRYQFPPRRRMAWAVRRAVCWGACCLSAGLVFASAPSGNPATNAPGTAAKSSPAAAAKDAGSPSELAQPTAKPDGKEPSSPTGAQKSAAPPVPDKEPYLSIVRRNPFGLKDPPPPKPPEPEPQPETQPSALKLTGISTLLGGKHAMFVLMEKGKQPVYSGLVAEGDTDPMIAGLQVISIDPEAGAVRVNYGGSELLLDFKNNGIEPPKATVAQKGKPGVRTSATRRVVTRSGTAAQTGFPAHRTSGGRSSSGAGSVRAGSSSFRSSTSPRVYSPSVPPRTSRSTHANQPRRLSPAEQILVLRAQQEHARQSGISLPPLPPVPGANTDEDLGGGNIPVPPSLPAPPPLPR